MQMRIMMTLTSLAQKRPILFPDKKINTTRTKQTAIVFLNLFGSFFLTKNFHNLEQSQNGRRATAAEIKGVCYHIVWS